MFRRIGVDTQTSHFPGYHPQLNVPSFELIDFTVTRQRQSYYKNTLLVAEKYEKTESRRFEVKK